MLDTRRFAQRRQHGLRLRWLLFRNRLIASPAFQRWALGNPLTRMKTRRHARALFDLTAGFVYSQVATALVESGLLDVLAAEPLATSDAAMLAGLDEAAARTLLTAAASLDLTEMQDGLWTLGERGAALAGTPGLGDMIRHHRLFYADLADPLAMLRREGPTRLSSLWDYAAGAGAEEAATYSRLMTATQPLVAAQAIAAFPFARHRALLDIGGGQGAFLRAVGDAAPGLRLGLFDRPEVIATLAPSANITVHAGSFLADPLPRGYDLHTLVRVLHDHDDAAAMTLLRASRAALAPGGKLVIVEPMATLGGAPEGHAYFGFYLAAMGSGRPREMAEIKAMAAAAGFISAKERSTPLPLVARCLEVRA